MNGATLRVYRQLLGYEVAHYAEKIDVNRRTVIRWEQGDKPVPEDVAVRVRADLNTLDTLIDRLQADVTETDERVQLTAYRDRGVLRAETGLVVDRQIYNAAVGLAAFALEGEGKEVTIEWDNG